MTSLGVAGSEAAGSGSPGSPVSTAARPEPAVPPIRRSVLVRSDRPHVFDVFVREIGQWWPTRPLSLGGAERVAKVLVEQCLDGRVYEVWHDGTEADWGRVVAWEPPERFAMTWEITSRQEGGATTEVELRFLDLGPSLTRVELEHRGWDRLSAAVACAHEEGYGAGWDLVLDHLATACA